MLRKHIHHYLRYCTVACLTVSGLAASEHHGQVKFGGLPVPGAAVTVTQGDKKFTAVTDQQGAFSFPDIPDGIWSEQVEMLCFSPIKQEVAIAPNAPSPEWELKLLPFDEIKASAPPPPPPAAVTSTATPGAATNGTPAVAQNAVAPAKPGKPDPKRPARNGKGVAPATPQTGFQRADLNASSDAPKPPAESAPAASSQPTELSQSATDGLLINGSVNNGASSPFATSPAFGNNRRGFRSLYNGNLSLTMDNSALDARSFSITGQDTPKPAFNHLQGGVSFGGPLKYPIKFVQAPNFFVGYQFTRNRNANTQSGLMPTDLERGGDFSQSVNSLGQPAQIFDPNTGQPFPNNVIPTSRISPQARSLLALYPQPNFTSDRYNYQIPIIGTNNSDGFQTRLNKTIDRKDQASGTFAYQRTGSDNHNLFGFVDNSQTSGMDVNLTWSRRFSQRLFSNFRYQFTRSATRLTPFFSNRENISGQAGITGNNQDPLNYGPPNLNFSSGISGLYDAQQSFTRAQTHSFGFDTQWNHSPHNITVGVDFRRQQFNYLSQQDARGTFTFNGASTQPPGGALGTGSDFAGFLLGIPDTSSIAFGNADKYFRASSYDAYINDDWRVGPSLTINAGLRWEYSAPITEIYGRLVNLDIAPGFSAIAPVIGYNPTGSLTGQKYPSSLINPDKHAFAPRAAIAWHPILGSSMIVRAGYGVYYDTSVYQSLAIQMAQQSPLSKSLSVQNTPSNPLTLASGFNAAPNITSNTFAIDPNFRIGYAHNWQASIQRDLPGGLVMIATYLGIKGTRARQSFLPNTYPAGAPNPCDSCPSGYTYNASNGNSTRESGQFQIRRRLHNGFTATAQYTYSKALDDAALGGKGGGGTVIAQNWLNLAAERGLSSFDQRHQLSLQVQYSPGVGLHGGALMSGWRGAIFKEWTIVSQITAGTGFPLTPIYASAVQGTGFTGSIRPDYTGLSVTDGAPGFHLNRDAYTQPANGQWGNAGRNSITGPSQFVMNASLQRGFSLGDRRNIDLRLDATNPLNHVTYPSWNTTVTSTQFGLPGSANGMRVVRANVRLRF